MTPLSELVLTSGNTGGISWQIQRGFVLKTYESESEALQSITLNERVLDRQKQNCVLLALRSPSTICLEMTEFFGLREL